MRKNPTTLNSIYLTLLFISASVFQLFGQTDFDKKISMLSDSVAKKINDRGKTKVAVWDFTDADGNVTNLGKYLSEEISVNLTNAAQTFSVMDRNHLNTILREHKLNSEGFIDANTAKELGKMNAVDAIVTGTVIVFNDKLKLTIKVLDTETALIIAATKGDLPIDEDVASFLGIPDVTSDNNGANRGFNRPLSSNEQYNNPETVSKDCEQKNTGDFCFTNSTKGRIRVNLNIVQGYFNTQYMVLESGQTQCFYNLQAVAYKYDVRQSSGEIAWGGWQLTEYTQGQILVEKCKSKTFVIK